MHADLVKGTDDSDCGEIGWANVKKCKARHAIEQKLTISASKYLGVSAGIVRGNRDRLLYRQYSGSTSQIESARNMPVVGPTTWRHEPFIS